MERLLFCVAAGRRKGHQ